MPKSARAVCLPQLPRFVKFSTLALSAALAWGCGRPATEQECQEILRQAAELELRERLGNDELIESEVKAIEASMHESMMQKCVGKRITEGALACIRQAKTVDQLFGECF